SGLRFRSLGSLRHKGIELSLSGELLPGLSMVAGAWFLDARVSGEEVQSGKIGKRPVGSLDRTAVVSLDYRPSPQSPVSGELTFAEIGKRVANVSNTLVIAPRTAWGIGGRYRLSIGRTKMSLHA